VSSENPLGLQGAAPWRSLARALSAAQRAKYIPLWGVHGLAIAQQGAPFPSYSSFFRPGGDLSRARSFGRTCEHLEPGRLRVR